MRTLLSGIKSQREYSPRPWFIVRARIVKEEKRGVVAESIS